MSRRAAKSRNKAVVMAGVRLPPPEGGASTPARISREGAIVHAMRVPLLAFALAALVTTVFWGAQFNDFALDDSGYLTGNADLRLGLSPSGVRWAFTSLIQCNWHPLTWISHLLDQDLFGLSARGPHLVNVGFLRAFTVVDGIVITIIDGETPAAARDGHLFLGMERAEEAAGA